MHTTQTTTPLNRLMVAGTLSAILGLSGCANMGDGIPGGGDSENESFFKNTHDMMDRLNGLSTAITQKQTLTMDETLRRLGRERLDLTTLNRTAIRGALEGTGANPVPLAFSQLTEETLACKEGLAFTFKSTNSRYAFHSPVKWQHATKGFSYRVDMIFNKCVSDQSILETVIIDGGPVDTIRKRTVFELLNTDDLVSPSL